MKLARIDNKIYKKIMQGMLMKRRIIYLIIVGLFFLVFMASANLFQDITQSDFNNGTFYYTFYNSSGFVQLNISQGFASGNFISRIFNAGSNVSWKNVSWL